MKSWISISDGAASARTPPLIARLLLALLTLITPGSAWAGYITLQVTTTNTVQGEQLQSRVSVTNKGNEAAGNMQVHVEFQGRRHSSAPFSTLGVGQTHAAGFSLPLAGASPGRHSMTIFADYNDINGYAFTALSYADLVIGEDHPPKLHGMIDAVELGSEASIQLRLKNLDSTQRSLKLRLVLPKEISSPQVERQLVLTGSSEQALQFPLRNFSALDGSTYQVFVAIEYDEQGRHSSLHIPGTIKIVAARDFLKTYRMPLFIVIGLLVLLLLGLQLYPRLRKPRAP